MKKIIWLTGRSGSGKSIAASCFLQAGCDVVDADKIAREIMDVNMPAYNEIVRDFGTEILNHNKTINRKKLGDIVFSSDKKLLLLNRLTHKHIYTKIKSSIDASCKEITVVDAPLLPEDNTIYNCLLVITSPDNVRIKRIVERDGITPKQAKLRLSSQKDDAEYIKKADYVLENKGDITEFKSSVHKFIENIKG